MTINNPELHKRLGYLEIAASFAPKYTYDQAARAATMMSEITKHVSETFRKNGFKAGGNDEARNLQVALYEYLLARNPEAWGLKLGEEFGDMYARGAIPEAAPGTDGKPPPMPPRLCFNCGLPREGEDVLCLNCRGNSPRL